MKTQNTVKTLLMILALTLGATGLGARTVAAEESVEDVNVMGVFVEFGPTFFVPVGNSDLPVLLIEDEESAKIGPGGGAQLGVGFDTKWAGIGTKLRYEVFGAKWAYGDGPTGMIQWDVAEVKLFVLDWFRDKPGKLRPYLVGGGGINFNGVSGLAGQASAGIGTQYQLGKHLYLGLEGTYRALLSHEGISSLGGAATAGFRF